MKVFISNRLENLVATLAEQLKEPLSGPLTPETVVVQSSGMAKWISLQLALRHGVAANYHFPFPNAFIENIFYAYLPEYPDHSNFDKNVLTWCILDLLPTLKNHDQFPLVRKYLDAGKDQKSLFQLAEKIAQTFDQYLIFRPDMIMKWEQGENGGPEETWQAILWRHILDKQGFWHKAALRHKLIDAIPRGPCRPEVLPERLSVFGISYLPPYHLDMLARISTYLPVSCYYLNPSREFWADIKSGPEIFRVVRKMSKSRPDMNDQLLHLETSNSLLATWGAQGRDYFRLMEEMPAEYFDLFEDCGRDSLLHRIQDDIYKLGEPQEERGEQERLDPGDKTIQIHACHNPIREVETLHDVLLMLFEQDGTMTPEDVLVMTPDIETYAPCIEAVFDAREPKIPYSIADRSSLAANVLAGGLISVLNIAESRFKVSDVLALLDNPAISEKFEITPGNREIIDYWMNQTHIKWGIDEAHRRSFNLPSFGQNTWKAGLDRLMAGVMFDGRTSEIYAGILPFGDIESEQTAVLGQFLVFWEKLLDLRNIFGTVHSLEAWCVILKDVLAGLFSESDTYRNERYRLQKVIDGLGAEQRNSGCKTLIELSVVQSYLKDALLRTNESPGFLNGGVSVCAMLPMRSIPFSVIYLLGMNSDAYPRRDGKVGFNVMEHEKRTGDRSVRHDDQYLFLECILSARKYLMISYNGLSQTDNSSLLPSVLVGDLLDYVDRNYAFEDFGTVSGAITRNHRIHAFSPDYFGEGKTLFSYSKSNYLSACAIAGCPEKRKPFLNEPIVLSGPPEKTISIQNLIHFYTEPVQYFLENCLGMKLPAQLWKEEQESEPFRIDPLNAYKIKTDLLENRQREDDRMIFERKRAEGVLPVSIAGAHLFNDMRIKTKAFTAKITEYLESPSREKVTVNISLDGDQLTGVLDCLHDHYRLFYRPAKLKMKDYINAWISHLVLNAADCDDYPRTSLLIGEDGFWRFEPLPDALKILKILIKYYRMGHTKPLKYFPRASWAYATVLWQKNKSVEDALEAARAAWDSDETGYVQADSESIASRICFEEGSPIDDEFQQTAEDILKELCLRLKKEDTTHEAF